MVNDQLKVFKHKNNDNKGKIAEVKTKTVLPRDAYYTKMTSKEIWKDEKK